jgi:putative addiction module component (TIGR02574 family)
MKTDAKKILEEAMQLEPATRAFIAEALLEGLDFEQDFEVSQTWRAEIQRRCDEIDRGNAKLVDSDTVMAELRKKHA